MQEAFKKLKIERVVWICGGALSVKQAIAAEKLIKSRFLDNLEFAQWFKCFYDANSQLDDSYNQSDVNTTISCDEENLTQDIIDESEPEEVLVKQKKPSNRGSVSVI